MIYLCLNFIFFNIYIRKKKDLCAYGPRGCGFRSWHWHYHYAVSRMSMGIKWALCPSEALVSDFRADLSTNMAVKGSDGLMHFRRLLYPAIVVKPYDTGSKNFAFFINDGCQRALIWWNLVRNSAHNFIKFYLRRPTLFRFFNVNLKELGV